MFGMKWGPRGLVRIPVLQYLIKIVKSMGSRDCTSSMHLRCLPRVQSIQRSQSSHWHCERGIIFLEVLKPIQEVVEPDESICDSVLALIREGESARCGSLNIAL